MGQFIYIFVLLVIAHAASAGQPPTSADESLAARGKLANQALRDGEYSKAAALYRELLKVLPNNPGLHLNLAIALDKAGQASAAIPEAEFATRANPTSAPAWFLIGLAYAQLNQPKKALPPLRQAVRLDSKNTAALFELADAELSTGDAGNACADFAKLASLQPDSPKAWEGSARAYLSLSESSFRQLKAQAPQSEFFLALSARAHASDGKYGDALSLYASALQELPSFPGLHGARSQLYSLTKHADWAAIEEEREARVAKPDCGERPAACAALSADWQQTLRAANKNRSPENLYWTALASSHLAEDSLKRLATFTEAPELHAVMADAYQHMGRRVDAVAEWRKALALKPSDHLLQARLAESLLHVREYPEAEQILSSLVAQQPENGEYQYLFGTALLRKNREAEALPHLLAATSFLPDLLPAQESLGLAYLGLDKPDQAVAPLEKALPLDDGSISFALNTAYRKLGRQLKARAALARYQKLTNGQTPDNGSPGNPISDRPIDPPQ